MKLTLKTILIGLFSVMLVNGVYASENKTSENVVDNSDTLPQYDSSTRYNNVQQSTNDTMREFYIATKLAKSEGLKSFHDYALDVVINYYLKNGTKYIFDSELEVISIERPDVINESVSDQVTLSEYQVALYNCHDQWVRSDKYKRSYIEYINAAIQ